MDPEPASGRSRRTVEPSGWGVLALTLVVLALLGSVAIPARQTWRITAVIRETTQVLAPARVLEARLQSGLAEELAALQSYALSGDTALLGRYRASADEDARRLDALDDLGPRLGSPSTARVEAARLSVSEWRQAAESLVARRHDRSAFAAELEAAQPRYDASHQALVALSSDLATETRERDDRVRQLEHFSLVSNVVLVLAALGALIGVAILAVRERHALAAARRRARREAALRGAAEALAGALTSDDVTQLIAQTALAAVEGRGAFVEEICPAPRDGRRVVEVRAASGSGVPAVGATCELAGSYTERVASSGEPLLIADLAAGGDSPASTLPSAPGSALALPLGPRGAPAGALFVLAPEGTSFTAEDLARASIFGDLAALAYERVGLLEEAYEGRRKLERVLKSRSRLIRGFSHDVKNPIGAADGYAALLSDGIYGELSAKQMEGIGRIRRGIHSALSLIDDLHELGRAETGHLILSPAPLDLGELAMVLGEEYQAAAGAAGLTLQVEVEPNLPVIQTSTTRVRQIASNLLSNAIKYTDCGTVTVRVLTRAAAASGDGRPWVLMEVADTGRGIPPDRREFIFEEFSRIGDGTKPGAGLGLAISRLLAEALGGRITLESELGRGSTFTLWLPVEPTAPRAGGAD